MSDSGNKISISELEKQFDREVERFSNEQTGQTTAVDAALVLSLVENAIARMHPGAARLCDIGCGAGNFSLRIARKIPGLRLTLLDLSCPMLERARQRLEAEGFVVEEAIQCDIATAVLPENRFDAVIAATSLHHLRSRADWRSVFGRIHDSLVEGGSFWIWDLIRHENADVELLQKERYAEYLTALQGEAFQRRIFEYIDRSDSPETLPCLMQTLSEVGFRSVDIVHKNIVFAAIVATR